MRCPHCNHLSSISTQTDIIKCENCQQNFIKIEDDNPNNHHSDKHFVTIGGNIILPNHNKNMNKQDFSLESELDFCKVELINKQKRIDELYNMNQRNLKIMEDLRDEIECLKEKSYTDSNMATVGWAIFSCILIGLLVYAHYT
mgnify:CR=1 FL=1